MNEIKLIIKLPPVTKKNSQQILINHKTGKPFIAPSKKYREYERDAGFFLRPLEIDYPVNIKAVYYMPSRRRVDKTNLESALCDVLVKHHVIKDDHSGIVVSTDGSRVRYDKNNPRTEIYITKLEENEDGRC